MNRVTRLVAAGGVAALAACVAAQGSGRTPSPRQFSQPVFDAQGKEVAEATLVEVGRDSVRVEVQATALPPGTHGTHLHAVGACDPPAFTTAGPHLNPANRQHGLRNPNGPHLGDLPNLVVGADGRGRMEAIVRGSLAPGQAPIFDADGTALVIHAGADDMVTDPSGNSGARIACAIIATPTSRGTE